MLRVNEIQHGKPGAADASPDGRVRRRQSGHRAEDGRTGGRLQLPRDGAEDAALPALEQKPAGHRAAISGQGDGTQPGAADASVRLVAAHPTRERTADLPPLLPRAITAADVSHAGGCGCRSRRPLGPGGAAHSAARVSRIPQDQIPAFSWDVGVPLSTGTGSVRHICSPRPSCENT